MRYKPVIYCSIKTSEPFSDDKAIRKWFYNTILYQNIQVYSNRCFFAIDYEKDMSRDAYDPNASIYIDIMSGHSVKRRQYSARPKLEKILSDKSIAAIHVLNYSALGESMDEVLDVYEKCASKQIAILTTNYNLSSTVEPYSTAETGGFFDQNMYEAAIKYLQTCSIETGRGHIQKNVDMNFIHAFFLYEGYLISEKAATKLCNMSPNAFHDRCYYMETHPIDFLYESGKDKDSNTYGVIQEDWLTKYGKDPKVGFNINDYKEQPMRYGSIPMTSSESDAYEAAKNAATESRKLIRKGLSSKVVKTPGQNQFCDTFRMLDDDSFDDIENFDLQGKCRELGLPLLTSIDFQRYRRKLHLMDSRSRYRVHTDGSPWEHAIDDYLKAVPEPNRASNTFLDWFIEQ